ncbi:hypothetical protein ACEWY4_011374 [Coilia grayii]|uniref:IQCH-like ATP-grasp domain-containing protein n=1 Tax=Coilia grayii TaxID=363190 RepID=A0ABD1K4L6_9TELE
MLRLLSNPVHPKIRDVMCESYGIHFPELPKRATNTLSQDGRAYLLSHADKTAVASPTGGHWLSAQLSPRRPTPLLSLTAAWRRAIFRAAGGAVCCAGERHLPACVLGGSFIVRTPWWGYLGCVALPSGWLHEACMWLPCLHASQRALAEFISLTEGCAQPRRATQIMNVQHAEVESSPKRLGPFLDINRAYFLFAGLWMGGLEQFYLRLCKAGKAECYIHSMEVRTSTQKAVTGRAFGALAIVPSVRNSVYLAPPLSEEDMRAGLASLLEKPSDLGLAEAAVLPKAAQLHVREDTSLPKMVSLGSSEKVCKRRRDMTRTKGTPKAVTEMATTPPPSQASKMSGKRVEMRRGTRLIPLTSACLPGPQATPSSRFPFMIVEGQLDTSAPDFCRFRQHYCLCGGELRGALGRLERVLRRFMVPMALVSGERLVELVQSGALEVGGRGGGGAGGHGCRLSALESRLLLTLENREEVQEVVGRPGRRFRGEGGAEAAAVRIQACWRRHRARSAYLQQRRRRWAAATIAVSWLMHAQLSRVRRALQARRLRSLHNCQRRAKYLADNWKRISTSRRTIIHLPSLGFSQEQRFSLWGLFDIMQNSQMGRLCDVFDDNVQVIYLAPKPVGEDLSEYYTRLLALRKAVQQGDPDAPKDPCFKRVTILTPEAWQHFPTHNMCLSTVLWHSPHTLQRIRHLIQGQQAYIVAGVPHPDDLLVAEELDVPILGPEPAVAQLYGTKSGGRRVFVSAGVSVPPGQRDIYTLQQLHEVLADLMTQHLEVGRWLFKIDGELGGRGTAYCDMCHLHSLAWAQQRRARHQPQHWDTEWAKGQPLMSQGMFDPPDLSAYSTLRHGQALLCSALLCSALRCLAMKLLFPLGARFHNGVGCGGLNGGLFSTWGPSESAASRAVQGTLPLPPPHLAQMDTILHRAFLFLKRRFGFSKKPQSLTNKEGGAEEEVLIRFLEEVPQLLAQHARPTHTSIFPTWDNFLSHFLRYGGVVEAYPPSDSVTCLTADVLVEPAGEVQVLVCGDQLHGPSGLEVLGWSVPQTSVCPDALHQLCTRVGRACLERGILGYVSVDLVTFLHPGTNEQQVWAVDLDLGYSNQLSLTQLTLAMSGATLDCRTSRLEVPAPIKQKTSLPRPKAQTSHVTSRYAVIGSRLLHTNLSMVHYSVFFQMCKAQGIGFDIKGSLMTFARNLSIIHQEISTPNMQGVSNFKDLIKEIDAVLGLTVQNKSQESTEDQTEAGSDTGQD